MELLKNLNCFQKNLKLNFDLCQRAEIVQVGLNMNLYDDIGDASSSLEGRHLVNGWVWHVNIGLHRKYTLVIEWSTT